MMNWINGSVCKIQEYFESTTIHGIQYILQPGRNILERLFWILASVFATYCTCRLLSASWTNFQTSAVSFVVDTAYLDWDTHFPAISLCEAESQDKLEDASTRIFGVNRNRDFDFFLRDIAYFDGKCDTCKLYEPSNNFPANISYIVSRTRSSCIEFMANCSWNGIKFDCCEYFLPLETELGICYSLNSMHVPRSINQLKFISNMDNPSGILNFDFLEYKAYLFIHPKEDVPFINHPTDEKTAITTFDNSDIIFKVRDIANDELLRAVSVGQRNCRFPNENYLQVYKYYSYSACVVNCRARAQINLCNCTHHFMPKIAGINTCNITGLICLSKYLGTLLMIDILLNEPRIKCLLLKRRPL